MAPTWQYSITPGQKSPVHVLHLAPHFWFRQGLAFVGGEGVTGPAGQPGDKNTVVRFPRQRGRWQAARKRPQTREHSALPSASARARRRRDAPLVANQKELAAGRRRMIDHAARTDNNPSYSSHPPRHYSNLSYRHRGRGPGSPRPRPTPRGRARRRCATCWCSWGLGLPSTSRWLCVCPLSQDAYGSKIASL